MARYNRNNLEKHVFSDRVKWGVTVLCILLIGVFLAAACTQGFTNGNPWGWFDKKEETEKEQVDAGGGGIMAPVEDSVGAMGLSVTKLAREEYGAYGIMPIADTAFTIKASYTDTAVTYKELDWTIKWKSGASGQWGNGKTVTEYATISPSQDTLTLTLTVKKAFGEQIIITATNRLNPECTKSATLDYAKRVTGVTFDFTGTTGKYVGGTAFHAPGSVASGQDTAVLTKVTPTYTYSTVYSVEDTFSISKVEWAVNPDFVTEFKKIAQSSSLYAGNVKTVVDAIESTGKKTTVSVDSIPDFTVQQVIWKKLCGSAYTSSTELDNSLKQLFALYMQKGESTQYRGVFLLYFTATGTHSSFSVGDTSNIGLTYENNFFGTVAQANSLKVDKAAFVA